MIEDDIGQAEQSILLLCNLESRLYFTLTIASRWKTLLPKKVRVVLELVSNRVRTIAFSSLLERWVMEHGVSAILGLLEVSWPVLQRPHPLRDDGEDRDTILGQVDPVVLDSRSFAGRENFKVLVQDARTGFELEDRIDVEESLPTFDAFVVRAFVL